jgi:hypothetical protein
LRTKRVKLDALTPASLLIRPFDSRDVLRRKDNPRLAELLNRRFHEGLGSGESTLVDLLVNEFLNIAAKRQCHA